MLTQIAFEYGGDIWVSQSMVVMPAELRVPLLLKEIPIFHQMDNGSHLILTALVYHRFMLYGTGRKSYTTYLVSVSFGTTWMDN